MKHSWKSNTMFLLCISVRLPSALSEQYITNQGISQAGLTLTSKMPQRLTEQPFKYTCDVCGKGFRTSWLLNRHVLIHTGEKPFACTFCEKRFNQRSSLRSHMVLHYNMNSL